MRWLLALLLLGTSRAAAQASPYLPLDHPLLPLAEYLIARGDVADPSPLLRPFRRADLIAAIDAARLDPASASGRLAARLRAELGDPAPADWAAFRARLGIETGSRARRDLLHPAGDGGAWFFGEAALEGRFRNLLLVSRPVASNRLKADPDWAGGSIQQRKNQAYRFADAYVAAQFDRVHLTFGQLSRNWGPAGVLGLSLSDYGYPRTDASLALRFRDFQFDVVATQLTGMTDALGNHRSRYLLAHRLSVRLSSRFWLGLWETGVLAPDRASVDPTFFNPMVLLSFPVQLGLPDDRNTTIGGDLRWQAGRVRFEGQAMIDDRWRSKADPNGTGEPAHPGRWALSGAAAGPLGERAGWRASLAAVSSLAYRTGDSTENFVDRGIGIGPHFTDGVVGTVAVSLPVRDQWLVTPDLTYQVQGEGRIGDPFPTGTAFTDTPEIFIGRPERTLRVGLSLSGGAGRFAVTGSGGYFRTVSAGHAPGPVRNRFEGRVTATIGLSRQGAIQ